MNKSQNGKGDTPRPINYSQYCRNYDDINWSPVKKTVEEWVDCLNLRTTILGWDFTTRDDTKITLKDFINQLTLCTVSDLRLIDTIITNFNDDPDYVSCWECGQAFKWEDLHKMSYRNESFVCQKCNFN